MRLSLLLLFACGLTACRDWQPEPCLDGPGPFTTGPNLHAEVEGNLVRLSDYSGGWWPQYDTTDHFLAIGGINGTWDDGEALVVTVRGFHGVGYYPMSPSNIPGTSWGSYSCERDPSYSALGWEGDNVTVVAFDSLTGEVTGTFEFRVSQGDGGPVLHVRNGQFRVIPVNWGPSAGPE